MNLRDRLQLVARVLAGDIELVEVRLKGRVLSSSEHVTGGGGRMEIIGTFAQRGYGGYDKGDIVDIRFTAIQEDSPQEWTMETGKATDGALKK